MYIKKDIVWKFYNDKSVIYNSRNDKTISLNETSTKILAELIINKKNLKKIAVGFQLENFENKEYNYDETLNDITDCYNQLHSSGFFTDDENEAGFISLIGLTSGLETAALEITNACNLKCLHCYEGQHSINGNMIQLSDVNIIARKLGELSPLAIVLTGGEPFLHPNLLEIVKLFNEQNIKVVIFTNGQILNEKLIYELSNMNVLVRISLEGHNSFVNDSIRGKGSFDKALKFIEICRKYNVSTGYSFTINRHNHKFFFDMLNFAESMEVCEIEMSEILDINSDVDLSSLALNMDQLKELRVNTLKALEMSQAFRKGFGIYRKRPNKNHICSAGTSNIFINSNGDIYPCNLFEGNERYFAGNILNEDFLKIWNNNEAFKELRSITKTDIDDCSNCEAINNCTGGCRARALLANDNIKSKMDDTFCEITKSLVESMQLNTIK